MKTDFSVAGAVARNEEFYEHCLRRFRQRDSNGEAREQALPTWTESVER